MIRSRLFWRLYVGYVLLIVLCTLVVGWLVAAQIEEETIASTRRSLQAQAHLLREITVQTMADQPGGLLQQRVASLGAEVDARFTVIAADGVVLADTLGAPGAMANHGDRPEIVAARRTRFGTSTRLSATAGVQMLYVALPIGSGDPPRGYVRAALPLHVLYDQLARLRTTIAVVAGSAALVALGLGFLFVRRTAWRMAALQWHAQGIAHGEYDRRISVRGRDEVAQLAVALNEIADSARDRMATITRDRNQVLAILASIVEGVVAVDVEQRVLHMNRSAQRILEVRHNSVGQPLAAVTEVEEVSSVLSETLQSGQAHRREVRRDGRPRDQFLVMYASPLHDGHGTLAGAVVVLHDVSELRQLEAMRRDFVANVSHELKTPITAIRGMVETMLDAREMASEQRQHFLRRISDQSMRLSALVSDLLTLSRLESQEPVPHRQAVDLRGPVQAAAGALLPVAEGRGIRLQVRLPASPVDVLGDAEALRQMTSNLLDNAVKYTASGGRIDVELAVRDEHAVLEVRDTGIGIEAKHQDRIFQRFYRVDKARSREVGGTGLGLSIVKHVALSHGGSVSVDSAPGRGSTFRVELPRLRAEVLRASTHGAEQTQGQGEQQPETEGR